MPLVDVPANAIPTPVVEVCRELAAAGHRAWIVGGCLRDLLLERPINDWDIATSALPKQVKKVFRRVIPTGIAHGTVTVLWKNEPYEVTTLRGEGAYSDGRRPDEVFFVSDIDEDLARRDFTINAIAYDPLADRLADPFDGRGDLGRGLIRAVGDPAERFAEDGLRILRGARFVATLELELDPGTRSAFAGALTTFDKVSRERVRDEWLKAMKAKRPSRAFEVMRETGILAKSCPELVAQHGCEQNEWHAFDVWHHTLTTLDECTGEPIERVAALLHDIGKPKTRARSDKTNDWTFYNHERVGAKMADRWLRDYRFSNTERDKVVNLVANHLICYSSDWSDAAVRRFIRRVGVDEVDPLLRLGRADVVAKGRPVDDELADIEELRERVERLLEAGAALTTKDLAVGGRELMEHLTLTPGPRVGQIMRWLLERVIEEPKLNDADQLRELARQAHDELDTGEAAR